MQIRRVPKQVGGKVYESGCVQLCATVRRAAGLKDGDYVKIWVRVYDAESATEIGNGVVCAPLTSGGEIYLGQKMPGARAGHAVDLILIEPDAEA